MNKEEELQRMMETGIESDDLDSKAYQYVFTALRKESNTTLSPFFAERVAERVKPKRSTSREYLWLALGITTLLGALGFVISQIEFNISLGFLSGMKPYSGLVLFAAIFIGLLNWIDRRFISTKQHV